MFELFQKYVQEPLLLTASTAGRLVQPPSLSPWKRDGTVLTGLLASALALCPSRSNTVAVATFSTPLRAEFSARPLCRAPSWDDSCRVHPHSTPVASWFDCHFGERQFALVQPHPPLPLTHTASPGGVRTPVSCFSLLTCLPAHVLTLGPPPSDLVGERP